MSTPELLWTLCEHLQNFWMEMPEQRQLKRNRLCFGSKIEDYAPSIVVLGFKKMFSEILGPTRYLGGLQG